MTALRHKNNEVIERAAASWIVRQKRGLTPTEQDVYEQWLAADSRHASALAECQKGWACFDVLAAVHAPAGALPDPDFFAPPKRRSKRLIWLLPVPLAAAAAVAVGIYASHFCRPPSPSVVAPCEERALTDGSIVELKRGAAIETQFTPAERRVRLVRGEVQFNVAKDAAHPFVVIANGVEFRAVGTAFDVRMSQGTVELLVTEGKVKVAEPRASHSSTPAAAPIVAAGQRATVSFSSLDRGLSMLQVSAATEKEMDEWLAWQPHLIDFTDEPLSGIVSRLNRYNPVRLVVADPTLHDMRLSATLRSDNVDGFVRLLESHFSVRAERREAEIWLYKAAP